VCVCVCVYVATSLTRPSVAVACKLGVPVFGPPLPLNGVGPHGHHFRDWMLARLINGERVRLLDSRTHSGTGRHITHRHRQRRSSHMHIHTTDNAHTTHTQTHTHTNSTITDTQQTTQTTNTTQRATNTHTHTLHHTHTHTHTHTSSRCLAGGYERARLSRQAQQHAPAVPLASRGQVHCVKADAGDHVDLGRDCQSRHSLILFFV